MPRRHPIPRRTRLIASAALVAGVALTGTSPVTAQASGHASGLASGPASGPAAAPTVSLDTIVHGPWVRQVEANGTPGLTSASASALTLPLPIRAKPRTRAWAFPVREGTPISGTFGETGTYWPGGHAGIDFDGDLGDPVFAAINGRVIYATFNTGGYGNLVITRRADGTEVRYAHLDRISVDMGEWVRAGDRVGRMGATGQATGVHLHLEVRVNGGVTPTDPASVWSGKRPGIAKRPPAWSCAKYGGCTDQDRRSTGA